jgi:hypothetical protein
MWAANQKAQFAYAGIGLAESGLEKYLAANSVRLERGFDEATGSHVLDVVADPMHVNVALGLGSAAHSLRSALDTAVSTLLTRAKGRMAGSRVVFPVDESEEQLRSTFEDGSRTCPNCRHVMTSKGRYADIRQHLPELEELIFNEFKPWGKTSALWQLSRLDNLDKHRMIFPALGNVAWQGSHSSKDAAGGAFLGLYNTYSFMPGTRFTIGRGIEPIEIIHEGRFSATLIFQEDVPFGGEPAIETLKELVKLVTGIIETLQAHFERG